MTYRHLVTETFGDNHATVLYKNVCTIIHMHIPMVYVYSIDMIYGSCLG